VQVIQRAVALDHEWHGVPLPRGALVAFLLGSANRDERQFEDAATFRLGRPETPPHLAFGAGIHFCLGSHLARLEARIALEELLARWPELAVAEPLDDVPLADAFTTRGPARLLVSMR
jgi:cytochrome P450